MICTLYPLVFCAEPRDTQRPCCERANSALDSRCALKLKARVLLAEVVLLSAEPRAQVPACVTSP